MKVDYWKFTHFTSESYKFREKWDSYSFPLKEELMLITYNIDPLLGIVFDDKTTHFGSRNAWYSYKRFPIWESKGITNSWLIELHPIAENPNKPFGMAHESFEVLRPNYKED